MQGRVQKIFPNNNWTSDELVAEIVKAAAVKQAKLHGFFSGSIFADE
jgi:hypothetical protein